MAGFPAAPSMSLVRVQALPRVCLSFAKLTTTPAKGEEAMSRSINSAGLKLIEASEGLQIKAYKCPAGIWTIGYGHTAGVKEGDTCSQTQAEQWLGEDIKTAEDAVSRLVKVDLSDNQFAALVDFVFNVGQGEFARSTLLTRLNEGSYSLVPIYLKSWIFAGGKQQQGLITRRAAEAALWNSSQGAIA